MTQLDMFGARYPGVVKTESMKRADARAKLTLQERFDAFHRYNPHVLERMLVLAGQRLTQGEKYISVKALWEELRVSLSTNGNEYRLNNSFTAFYARALIAIAPHFAGVIETRKRKAK